LIVTGELGEIIGSIAVSYARRDGKCVGKPADHKEPARGERDIALARIIDLSMNAIQDECWGSLYVIRRDWN
jgi:hypothetical protein